MSEEARRYCMRAFGSIVQPIEVPYSGTWVPSTDHDRIVAELQARVDRLSEDSIKDNANFGRAFKGLEAERDQLAERCRELEVERDEADRRAGAAERKLAFEVDSRRRRDAWLHKAKEEAGHAQKESFDNVWAETLGKANERDTLRAEVERLTGCLQKANEQAEHFEREWYLRGDEVERLRILLKEWLDADEHKDWGEYERRVEKALEASR